MIRSRKRWLTLAGVLALVALAGIMLAAGRQGKDGGAPAGPAAQASVPPAPAIVELLQSDVTAAAAHDLRLFLPLSGSLRALNQAAVKAKVSGEIQQVLVREGEAVKAGQVLARIDPAEYEAKVTQARGQMLAARGQYDNSRQTWERNRTLVQRGFISQTAFENYRSNVDVAKANLDAAEGGLAVAAKALTDTVVKSPLDGMVSARSVQPGEKVSPDTRLIDVVDLRVLELEAPIPMSDVARVAIGQAVQLDVEGSGRFEGRLVRINPAVTQGTRSIMVYVRLDNPGSVLRAGMFAQGGLVLGERNGVVSIPATAVRSEGERAFVYVIENGLLAERTVSTGIRDDATGLVEITGGLADGAQVVRNNLGSLRAGSRVKLVKA